MSFESALFINGLNVKVSPIGLTNLRLVIEKETETSFFRRKINGDIEFGKLDCNILPELEKECCKTFPFTIYRTCQGENTVFVTAELPSKAFDWNKVSNTVKTTKIDIADSYKGVFRNWEKKINMCTMPFNRKLKYWYRKTNSSGEIDSYTYPTITSNRGRRFADWVFYCVQKTFDGTPYNSIIPSSISFMSQIMDLNINPCTGQQSIFTHAMTFQISDFVEPHSSSPADGTLADGRINESMAISLKDLLSSLKILFRLDWYIDSITGKFRIEHESFFANGYSYSTTENNIGLDLDESKYSQNVARIYGSYKNDSAEMYGIQELEISQNKALNSDKAAISDSTVVVPTDGMFNWFNTYQFSKIDDFELGNVKYDSECAILNDKGELQKNTLQNDMFVTFVNGVVMNPENLDKTKWVLIDCYEEPQIGEIGVLPENQAYLIKKATCERSALSNVLNARLSATALMRDFHRWERPFERGLMNYSDTPNGEKGKGIYREMYSVKKTKVLTEKINIPFCCDDSFDFRKLIKYKNLKADLKRAEFFFSSETIELELVLPSSCDSDLKFPVGGSTGCQARGTFLYEEDCYQVVSRNVDTSSGYGCVSFPANWYGKRKFYADGECGSYYEEVYLEADEPQNDC
jgi:hypothetical protein